MATTGQLVFSILVLLLLIALFILAIYSSSWVSQVATGASATLNNITAVISAIPGQILAAITGLWESLTKTLQDLIGGIISGRPATEIGNFVAAAKAQIAELGAHFERFFSVPVRDRVTGLLNQYVDGVRDWAAALKAKNMVLADQIEGRLRGTAEELSTFLNSLNPTDWAKDRLNGLFNNHIDVTKSQILANLNNNVSESLKQYEASQDSGRLISEVISAGLERVSRT